MTSNQTARALELLQRFNQGERIHIDTIIKNAQADAKDNIPNIWLNSNNEPVSEKTIRRVIDVIKEYFPDAFELVRTGKGEDNYYKAVTKKAFDNFINPELLSLMVHTFNIANKNDLFDKFDLDDEDKRLLQSKIKESNDFYEFKNKPLETLKHDRVMLNECEKAIKFRKCVIIEYNGNKFEVKPYKIIFMNENFYLGCEIEHETLEFAMYRVSKIKTIEDTPKTFNKTHEIDNFIKDMQTPFATYRQNYKKYLIDVKLEVSKEKAYFFKSKKFLKSQKEEELDNGNLLVSYKVTQLKEVDELVKRWLPYVKVVSPLELKNQIEDELRNYLSS